MTYRLQLPPLPGTQLDPLPIGTLLHRRYIIVAELARTQMTSVYLARTHRLGTLVVVKRLSLAARPAGIQRARAIAYLQREAQLLRQYRHRGIPRYRDGFRYGDDYYLIMQHIAGTPLDVLLESRALGRDDAIRVVCNLCRVVAFLHRQNPPIIHADLKPGNIILTPSGDVTLLDFGLARPQFPRFRSREPIGTPPYAAPEQWRGAPLDPRSDIYALGMVLRDLVPADPADADIAAIIERATELAPDKRYQQVDDLLHALEQALPTLRAARQHRLLLVWQLLGMLCVLVVLAIGMLQLPQPTLPQYVPATTTTVTPTILPPTPLQRRIVRRDMACSGRVPLPIMCSER